MLLETKKQLDDLNFGVFVLILIGSFIGVTISFFNFKFFMMFIFGIGGFLGFCVSFVISATFRQDEKFCDYLNESLLQERLESNWINDSYLPYRKLIKVTNENMKNVIYDMVNFYYQNTNEILNSNENIFNKFCNSIEEQFIDINIDFCDRKNLKTINDVLNYLKNKNVQYQHSVYVHKYDAGDSGSRAYLAAACSR